MAARNRAIVFEMTSLTPRSIEEAREALTSALKRQCLVEVYAGDEEWFSVGTINAVDETHFRLNALDRAGQPDGIEVRALAEVSGVETETDYLTRRIARLKDLYGTTPRNNPQRLAGSDSNLVRDALALSIEDGTVVTIWTDSGDIQYTGVVAKLSDNAGTILDLDEYGDADREVAFRIADIRALDFGGEHQRIIQHLRGWRPSRS